jgi:16S rRNA (guanine527-N7)-methyltransferase
MTLQEKLAGGLRALGLDLPQGTQQKLLDYVALLAKWNKVHNLTAVRDPEEMVTLHLLDALSVLPYLQGSSLLDVGSGGGLPGIPLAIARPELYVTLLDSSHKKSAFQRQAKVELGLKNVEVVCGRVEKYQPAQKFDMVISRAFSDLAEYVKLTDHLLSETGKWLAMKGVYPYDEIAQLKNVSVEVVPLTVPGLEAQRHLVFLKAA